MRNIISILLLTVNLYYLIKLLKSLDLLHPILILVLTLSTVLPLAFTMSRGGSSTATTSKMEHFVTQSAPSWMLQQS